MLEKMNLSKKRNWMIQSINDNCVYASTLLSVGKYTIAELSYLWDPEDRKLIANIRPAITTKKKDVMVVTGYYPLVISFDGDYLECFFKLTKVLDSLHYSSPSNGSFNIEGERFRISLKYKKEFTEVYTKDKEFCYDCIMEIYEPNKYNITNARIKSIGSYNVSITENRILECIKVRSTKVAPQIYEEK